MTPFEVLNGAPSIPVVVHAPHGGTRIPDEERPLFLLDAPALAEELRLMTDHRTDRLAEAAADLGAAAFVNRISRLVVDPERFPDEREEMEAVGMGFAYTATARGGVLRRLTSDDRARLKARWFDPYAAALERLVGEVRDRFGVCVIIDLHSYPSRALPYERHGNGPRPEVCIGTSAFHTPEWLAGLVEAACERLDLSHARNTPFSGCYVPLSMYRQDESVLSVMLEVRRDVYLDEASARPTDGEARVGELVAAVVREVGESRP
ncbi:MAG: N-formylglutamate amidohydrolase [Actinomycetota bacterium]